MIGRLLRVAFACASLVATGTLLPLPAAADVTVGGGSSDFMLKTYDPSGQNGPAEQTYYDSSTAAWYTNNLGGILVQAPAFVSYQGALYAFGVGLNQNMWQDVYNGSSWSGWTGMSLSMPTDGAVFASAPSAAVWNGVIE